MTKVALAKPPLAESKGKRTVLSKAVGEAGRPLPEAIRVDLEIKFSANLKGVRIHTGPLGDEVAKSLDAEAVTLGQHIFFQTGKWKPETAEGMDLLVHETAHTLQHAGPTLIHPQTSISQPGDAVERSADAHVSEAHAGKEKAAPQPIPEATAARRVAGIAPREKKTADPARTIEELGRALLLRTRADSHDRSGRIRNQLIRMEDNLRRDVLRWLENHMESHDWRSFVHLLAEEPPAGTEGTEDPQAKDGTKTKPAEGETEAGTPEAEQADSAKATPAEAGKQETGKEGSAKERADKDQPDTGKAAGEGASGRQMSPEEAAVEGAAADGKDGPQEADVAKPAIAAAGGEEASIADAPGSEAGGVAAAPQQAQATAAPATSAAPAPAEEPASGGGATGVTEAPTPVSQEDEQASRTGEAIEDRSDPASPSTGDSAPESATTAEDANPAPKAESSANLGMATDPSPETEQPTRSIADSATADPAGAADTSTPQTAETASASSPPEVAEPSPQPEASAPVIEPVPEPPPATETAEPATAESPAEAEIASGSHDPASESVPESSTATAEEPTATVESEAAPSAPATAGGMEQAGPASIPPSLLGEFAGEPSDAEPPAAAGGGGGGGGAAASAPAPPPEPAEDIIPAGNPGAAMQAIGSMKVGPASRAMGSAAATVSAKTNQQRIDLANAPPTIERPTGAPQGAPGSTAGNVPMSPPGGAPKAVATVAGGAPVPVADPVPVPPPGPSVSQAIASPKVTGTAEGKLSQADVDNIKQSVAAIPDTDPDLDQTVPPAPDLGLTEDADPSLSDKQQTALMDSAATNLQAGNEEAAAPMGEDHIYPKVEPGTITPDPSGSCDCGGGQKSSAASANGAKGTRPERGLEAVAEEESGEEVRQAANSGAGEVAQKQIDQKEKEDAAHTTSQEAVTKAIEENASQQATDRKNARKEVQDARKDWTKGQQDAVDTARTDSDKAVIGAHKDIAEKQKDASEEANGHIKAGNEKIVKARTDSEKKAKIAKINAENDDDDGGFFSWVASKVTSFFSALRDAINDIFDAARKLVNDAIELAQELVHEVIEAARTAIVGLIKIAGKAIALAGDILLAAFPDLQKKFRAKIENAVDSAVTAVNELADKLDNAIKTLLNGLLTALNAILCAYETILNGIVDVVATAVNGAIAYARTIVAALEMFAGLIDDVATVGPGPWISNFADSVMDGMRNHLWLALKAAVKKWFNELVTSIIGMGKQLLDFLFKGGLSLRKIAGFVWQALVSALPGMIVEFLIEQLIKMIIPAAGLIADIVKGLIAAWGVIKQVIQAFQLFYTFLKAVKDGNAGPQFATALAASAVVVLQFLANYLIARLGKAASGVTGRLKALAQRLMAFFKRVGKGAMKVVRKVAGVAIRGAKAVGHLAKRGAHTAGHAIKRGVKAVGRVARKVLSKTKAGRAVLKTYDKAKKKLGELHEKFKQWGEKRKENKKKNGAKRVQKALREIPSILERSAHTGLRGILLPARLLVWKLKYRLSKLRLEKAASRFRLLAAASPPETAPVGLMELPDEFLRDVLRSAVDKVMLSPEVDAAEEHIARQAPHGQMAFPFARDVQKHIASQSYPGQTASPFAGEVQISHPSHMLGYIRHFSRAETPVLHGPQKVKDLLRPDSKPVLRGEQRRFVRFLLEGGNVVSSSETGPRSKGRRKAYPTISNQITGRQASYPQINKKINKLAQSPRVTQDTIHEEFDGFVRKGIAPPGGATQAELFADVQLLTTGREGIRSTGMTAAEMAIASELIAAKRMTLSQVLDGTHAARGLSMAPTDANEEFRDSEKRRFKQIYGYNHDPFKPGKSPTTKQTMSRFKRITNLREIRAAHRNFASHDAQAHWESTPIGGHIARSQGREPMGRYDAMWGKAKNTTEKRQATFVRELTLFKSEKLLFTNLIEARTIITKIVIDRMREHYRLDDLKPPPGADTPPNPAQLDLPFAGPPSPQLELALGD